MGNILLLGGISEAKRLALTLHQRGMSVIYSIQGNVRTPILPCEVHVGGFSQYSRLDNTVSSRSLHNTQSNSQSSIEGLKQFVQHHKITTLIDCTHPYATDISAHARAACRDLQLPMYRFQRPSWDIGTLPHKAPTLANLLVEECDTSLNIADRVSSFQHVFWAMGKKTLLQLAPKKTGIQQWTFRTAVHCEINDPTINCLQEIGPFTLEHELTLLKSLRVDALVCKNSGSPVNESKLHAAAILGIPVFLLKRPDISAGILTFPSIEGLLDEIMTGSELPINTKAN